MKQQSMSILCSPHYFHTHHVFLISLEGDIRKVSKYQPLETILSWFSSYINLYASLDKFSKRHRDLCRQIGSISPLTQQYAITDFNEVDIRIYLPEKVIIHRGRLAEVNITFEGR